MILDYRVIDRIDYKLFVKKSEIKKYSSSLFLTMWLSVPSELWLENHQSVERFHANFQIEDYLLNRLSSP